MDAHLDKRYMDVAIRLSRWHQARTGTNPSVATVLVNDLGNGPVIGTRDSVRYPLDAHPDAYSGQNVPDKDGKYVPPWMMYFPYLGKAPALTARQWKVLALIVRCALWAFISQ